MRFLSQASLYLRTVRHLEPGQIWSRGRHVLHRLWWKVIGRRAPKPKGWRIKPLVPLYLGLEDVGRSGPWTDQVGASVARAKSIANQEFCFLNRRVTFDSRIAWQDPASSQLWRYHLHYFDYIQDLLVWAAKGDSQAAYETFRSLATSWMNLNDRIRGDGWHPYAISIRTVNWIQALSGFQRQLQEDKAFRTRLLSSLCGQARILSSDLEKDVRGNHLLANLRALVCFGLACQEKEPQRWFRETVTLLERELAEQILPDGGHFERSPGYHLVVLKYCLEIGLALRRNGRTPPQWLEDRLRRMLQYLAAILPSHGGLPLLKDTTWDAAPQPGEMLAAGALYLQDPEFKRSRDFGLYPFLLYGAAGWEEFEGWPLNSSPRQSVALEDSCHFVMRDDAKDDHLIFDAGKPCPDYLPAHAHADLLSYELSVSGQRIIVDSGVYEYSAGSWRDYFRSTRAHNSVELSGANQSEVWSSFRVGRRARPGKTLWLENKEFVLAQGSHDGYTQLPAPATHRRTVLWKPDKFWLIVDELLGAGCAQAASHVHLHPGLGLACLEDSIWQVEGSSFPLWIAAFGAQSLSIVRGQMEPARQGWYSERFGELRPNTVLTLHLVTALPFCFGYVIFKGTPGTVGLLPDAEGSRVAITQGGRELSLRLARDGTPVFK